MKEEERKDESHVLMSAREEEEEVDAHVLEGCENRMRRDRERSHV